MNTEVIDDYSYTWSVHDMLRFQYYDYSIIIHVKRDILNHVKIRRDLKFRIFKIY